MIFSYSFNIIFVYVHIYIFFFAHFICINYLCNFAKKKIFYIIIQYTDFFYTNFKLKVKIWHVRKIFRCVTLHFLVQNVYLRNHSTATEEYTITLAAGIISPLKATSKTHVSLIWSGGTAGRYVKYILRLLESYTVRISEICGVSLSLFNAYGGNCDFRPPVI